MKGSDDSKDVVWLYVACDLWMTYVYEACWSGMVLTGEKPKQMRNNRSLCPFVHNILHVDFAGIEAQPLGWQVSKKAPFKRYCLHTEWCGVM